MRQGRWSRWALLGGLLALVLAFSPTSAQGLAVPGPGEAAVEGQLLIDGKVAGRFASVSGLKMEVEVIEFVCRTGGGDCDDQDSIDWEGAVRKALWEMEALADGMERDAWASSRTGHDTQMNAIRNIKAIAVQTGDAFNETGATLRTKHDTVKNSINNVRAVMAGWDGTGAGAGEAVQAARRELGRIVSDLDSLNANWELRKAMGRLKTSDVTLERGRFDPLVLDWFNEVRAGSVERKSVSIVFMDRSGAEVARFNLDGAWPAAYAADVGVEQISFAVEEVKTGPQ